MIKSFDQIKENLRNAPEKRRLGVVAAQDRHTLEAVFLAAQEGLIEPVLIGDRGEINDLAKELNYSGELNCIDIESPEESALKAATLVRQGDLDCVMKGKIETGALMKVMVNREYGIRNSETMSMVAFVESPYYHKVFAITDAGLLTYPTVEQKRDSIENAVRAFHSLGVRVPKVAVLSAIEHVNPNMKETIEANQLKEMWLNNEFSQCVVEGPISYDLSMEPDAAKIKEYESPVAGDADLLVVPDLVSGNILAKSLAFTGGAKTAGAIIGAMVPLILTSRSTSKEDKYMSIILNACIGRV